VHHSRSSRGTASRTFALTLAVLALLAVSCGPAAPVDTPAPPVDTPAPPVDTPAPPVDTPPVDTPPAPTPEGVAPYDGAEPGSGEGLRIGYISLGDAVPFVRLVSEGIREQVELSGAEFVFCDSQIDAGEALACAQQLAVQEVDGVLNFQVFQDSSPEICAALPPDAPVIAIDIVQEPCQIAFMGADNHRAGMIAGEAMGRYAQENWDCDYTAYVSLESTAAGAANEARMGGYREGFTQFCEITDERVLDGADRTDPALTQVSDLLTALPGDRIVVVAINEDGIIGAIGAARTLGRDGDLYYSGQGTDPSIWCEIVANPNYIASSAYFPERYGRILVPAVIDAINGVEIPEELFTPHVVINADNIRDYYDPTDC
jgi:ribose transport system substrate-binding protein